MSKRCDGCVYYASGATYGRNLPDGGYAYEPSGTCRIGPPTTNETLDKTRWPLVWANEWCGCHSTRTDAEMMADAGPSPEQPEDWDDVLDLPKTHV